MRIRGLAGQKPWECVGEILEAAACLHALTKRREWVNDPIVAMLKHDLLTQYGAERLDAALDEFMTDSAEHHIPQDLAGKVAEYAL